MTTSDQLDVRRLGLVEYQTAWKQQKDLQQQRIEDQINDTVLLLEHPSVYTAGRRTEAWTLPQDGTPVVEIDRGGQVTWHGPGQIVGYPIVKLSKPIDVVKYVRRVETMIMAVCADLGVKTTRVDSRTGVWVPADDRGPERKVCAIGVRVSWAVTLHGFALNCNCDLGYYDRISPCGITDAGVTSLSKELDRDVSVDEVLPLVEQHMGLILE